MKKVLRVVAAAVLCLNIALAAAMAYDSVPERIEYEDGSYAIITTETDHTRAKTADQKVYTYYNSSNQRCFSYTLYATFSYNGVTSAAETVDFGIAIYRRGWDVESHSEYTFGNTAFGRASFSGPNGENRPVNISLTCDKDGNVR